MEDEEIAAQAREKSEIAAWLRAQAQADIKAAGIAADGPWEIDGSAIRGAGRSYSGGKPREVLVVKHTWRPEAEHMIRHDPQTEAARAESVLAVIDEYESAAAAACAMNVPAEHKWAPPHVNARVRALARVVRLLAYGYRHREGYLEEWKP